MEHREPVRAKLREIRGPLMGLLLPSLAGILGYYYQVHWVAPYAMLALTVSYFAVQLLSDLARHGRVKPEPVVMGLAGFVLLVHSLPLEGLLIMLLYSIAELLEAGSELLAIRHLQGLTKLIPARALVDRGGFVEVDIGSVRPGDVVLVRMGEGVPVDGVLLDDGLFDTSCLTGEPTPVNVKSGSLVYSGFINVGNPVRVKALRGAGESRFQRVVRLALEALEEKGSVEHTIERLLWLWLPLVILSFIIAYILLGPLRAPSILLVSCPSAFIITSAVNTAYSIASLARSGVVVRGSRPLERLCHVDTIVVDKTGTITYGSLRVSSINPPTGLSVEEFKTIAATVASTSLHPVSRALSKLTDSRLEIESVVEHQGLGVEALVGGRRVLLGGPGLIKGLNVVSGCSEDEITAWILVDGSPGHICLEEAVREDVVRALREAGDFRIIIASGDSEPRVRRIAVKLGVREYYAGMKPEDKLKLVSMLKERGARVAFVGDGVNDIAALARADVGLAVGSIDVVANVGDIVLGENPGRLAEVLREARRYARALTLSLTIIALIKLIALAGGLTGAIPLYLVLLLGDDGATLAGITAVIAYRALRT
ncbi:MAG: heavy metal translocating P-type ATPase [Acidilobaceae archaeon]